MHKKFVLFGQIFFVVALIFSGVYYYFNQQYTPSVSRSSIKLYDPNGTMPERQQELQNVGYLINGQEQGRLDGRCNSWLCAYNLNQRRSRGMVINPIRSLKINGHHLTKNNQMYYNSGYILGYSETCPKYRIDCEERIQTMKNSYQKYFNAPLYNVDKNDNILEVGKVSDNLTNCEKNADCSNTILALCNPGTFVAGPINMEAKFVIKEKQTNGCLLEFAFIKNIPPFGDSTMECVVPVTVVEAKEVPNYLFNSKYENCSGLLKDIIVKPAREITP